MKNFLKKYKTFIISGIVVAVLFTVYNIYIGGL